MEEELKSMLRSIDKQSGEFVEPVLKKPVDLAVWPAAGAACINSSVYNCVCLCSGAVGTQGHHSVPSVVSHSADVTCQG